MNKYVVLSISLALLALLATLWFAGGRPLLYGGAATGGASLQRPDGGVEHLGTAPRLPGTLKERHSVEGLPGTIAQFDSVFWEPDDTNSARELIRTTDLVQGKTVLEIGTGTGLLSLCCLQAGARRVVATDINPAAIANATYNADSLGFSDRLELRLVPEENFGAFVVIGDDEQFDLIVSNPPWEDQQPQSFADYALYDEGFDLLRSLLAGLDQHLAPGGKALLMYGCVSAIKKLQLAAPQYGLDVRLLDDRNLDELPEVFLPGMMLEVVPRR